MPGRFETWITSLRVSWMGINGRRIFGGFAKTVGDDMAELANDANLEHMPQYARDPVSVGLIASERQIEPGPTETQRTLAARLVRAVEQHKLQGSALALLLGLYYAEFFGAVLVQQNGRAYSLGGVPDLDDIQDLTTIPPWFVVSTVNLNPQIEPTLSKALLPTGTRPWWTFDWHGKDSLADQFCSRFAVLFPVTATDPQLGTAENLARIRRVIGDWRPAKATCVGIYVVGAGLQWDWPVRTWNFGGDWNAGGTGSSTDVTRFSP